MPVRFTAPLSEGFTSDWDRWEPLFLLIWKVAYGFELAPFQRWLLRAILETYPPGHKRAGQLRYRQVVISVARQNGKSDIAAILSIWGLLRRVTGNTIGIASNVDQANIVYLRCRNAVMRNPVLEARFTRTTATRGLETKDGSTYAVKAAKSDALQGFPVGTGIVDELHIVLAALWADMVNGTGARPNTLVVGISTAGDDSSLLLIDLYAKGEAAVQGDPKLSRFGFFLWESPDARVPDDDAELLELLIPANPMLASELVDAEDFVADVRATVGGDVAVIRYRLNRFVTGTAASFLETYAMWERCARDGQPYPAEQPVFFLDVAPTGALASIHAATLDGADIMHVELVASFVDPSTGDLVDALEALRVHSPRSFGVGSDQKAIVAELKRRGMPYEVVSGAEWATAANTAYQRIKGRTLIHESNALMAQQIPRAMRKSSGDTYRLSRVVSGVPIDAVLSMVGAVYVAEIARSGASVGVL